MKNKKERRKNRSLTVDFIRSPAWVNNQVVAQEEPKETNKLTREKTKEEEEAEEEMGELSPQVQYRPWRLMHLPSNASWRLPVSHRGH